MAGLITFLALPLVWHNAAASVSWQRRAASIWRRQSVRMAGTWRFFPQKIFFTTDLFFGRCAQRPNYFGGNPRSRDAAWIQSRPGQRRLRRRLFVFRFHPAGEWPAFPLRTRADVWLIAIRDLIRKILWLYKMINWKNTQPSCR